MTKHIYGIDFGTSNSVISILDTDTRSIVKTHSENSVIYFKEINEYYIGKEAVHKYLENNLKGRLLKSVKTLLPQANFTFTYILGKKYTAEDLVYLILSHLKKTADYFTGEDVKEVVMGRPVVFSEDPEKDKLAEKRLLAATKRAGFENIYFQYEPIAAGFLYEQNINKPETVLIGDFGGGTSDFTLMKLDKHTLDFSNRKSDILRTGGVHIGGDDMDAEIMWYKLVKYFGYGLKYDSYGKQLDLPVHIFRTLCEWEQMGFLKEGNIRRSLDDYYYHSKNNPAIKRLMTLIDNNLGFSLFQSIEKAKIDLSINDSTTINFDQSAIEISENLSIGELNEYTKEELNNINSFLKDFLNKASIAPNQIDTIFLTGGTSSLRSIQSLFTNQFTKEKLQGGDNFNSVANGLALSYYFLKQV